MKKAAIADAVWEMTKEVCREEGWDRRECEVSVRVYLFILHDSDHTWKRIASERETALAKRAPDCAGQLFHKVNRYLESYSYYSDTAYVVVVGCYSHIRKTVIGGPDSLLDAI